MMLKAMMEEKAMKLEGIQACVFDAYGTLFDVAAVARGADEALGEQALGHPVQAMCFVSSNGWDACSARAYGYRVMWCNRFGQPAERIPAEPDGMLSDLNGLPAVLGVA